jgi:hypothetical protein
MPHPYGSIGLIANMVGTLLMLRYPPSVQEYTESGRPIILWAGRESADGKYRYTMRKHAYSFALSLLFFGFFLQLLDLFAA